MRFPWVPVLVGAILPLPAQGVPRQEAERILDGPGSVQERVARLVTHLHAVMPFVATDYRERSVDQILARGSGNCADHARVLGTLLESRGIRTRWVQEINLQPPSESRAAAAAGKVRERGRQMSVFGRGHNDHRWLEVLDPGAGVWFPADSSIGVAGREAWVRQRLGFSSRTGAVADMIAPVFLEAREPGRGTVALSEDYLIEGFDRVHGGRLKGMPSWSRWTAGVRALEPLAAAAFRGEADLHRHGRLLDELAEAYASLAAEAGSGILPSPGRSPSPGAGSVQNR
ncbi:MAG: transglutaminase domain-containing protein [Acidobacteria bacterium]|nr:transglutaminase domain-containing protein [Acidobacteriota bacterium]